MAGDFVWFDLNTPTPAQSRDFYAAVMGWGIEVWEQADYTMFAASDGSTVGGIQALADEAVAGGASAHWLPYITVDDCDAAAVRGVELGGTLLLPPQDIPTVGRFSVLADPSGVPVAPFVPEGDMSPITPAPVGHSAWHDLASTDMDAAVAFYCGLFGWEIVHEMDMGMGTYRIFGTPGHPRGLGGFLPPAVDPKWATAPHWKIYTRVADLSVASHAVTDLGGRVVQGPLEVPGGDHVVLCIDPQGAPFALHHHAD